jgi:hypothetical protein
MDHAGTVRHIFPLIIHPFIGFIIRTAHGTLSSVKYEKTTAHNGCKDHNITPMPMQDGASEERVKLI